MTQVSIFQTHWDVPANFLFFSHLLQHRDISADVPSLSAASVPTEDIFEKSQLFTPVPDCQVHIRAALEANRCHGRTSSYVPSVLSSIAPCNKHTQLLIYGLLELAHRGDYQLTMVRVT